MINLKKLSNKEKYIRYSNMKARCGKEYQDKNPRYYGTFMCNEWLEDKKAFYKWLDENYYVVEGENQMDIFCDIKQGILVGKAKSLRNQIPDKVYQAMMNTDVKAINAKHYESVG